MAKNVKELVRDAEHLLTLVYEKDVFDGALCNVTDERNIPLFEQFYNDLECYKIHMDNDSYAFQLLESNAIIYNGDKINVPAIKNIIRILKEL
jgi:hypothetical protein